MFTRTLALTIPLLISACASLPEDLERPDHVKPLQGSPIVDVETDYSHSLSCLARHAKQQKYPAPRIAVGHITDLTGADDALTGRRLTQGATLMAISAVTKAGMRVVERFDMGVIQVELDYAKNGLLRDAPGVLRQTKAGQVEGADLYIVGGITEYNPNIRSSGKHGYIGSKSDSGGALSIGSNEYIIDVGLDLRIIDARSTEVLSVRSFRKQVRGQEVEAGIFSFVGGSVVDIGGGQRALEPVQTAVRAMVERSVFEFMSDLYGLKNSTCQADHLLQSAQQTGTDKSPSPVSAKVSPHKATSTGPAASNSRILSAERRKENAQPHRQKVRKPHTDGSKGKFYVAVGRYGTYSSAVTNLANIQSYLPQLESKINRVIEFYSPAPSTAIQYSLNLMEGSNQTSATEMCQRLQKIGYVCEVRTGHPATMRSADLRPDTVTHW